MLANYHIHTRRCRHAEGADEEYIKKAITEGLKVLGFSDHAPYIYPDGYESYYKMTPSESDEYFDSLRALRKKYEDKIKIYVGYEAEYYPALWDTTYNFWKSTNRPDYLILGQHFAAEEYPLSESIHSAEGSERGEDLEKYVDTLIAGLGTGCFSCLAHPDVFRFFGPRDKYVFEMSRLLTEVKKRDIPIEINLLGIAEGRHYPTELFWQIASEFSPKVIFGCDAHSPERVADRDEICAALRFADKHRLCVIDELPLVDPFKN